MALSPEMQELKNALAADIRMATQQQQQEIVSRIDQLLDAKLAQVNARIDSLEKSLGGVVHEQRQQKRMLQQHAEQLARGDEEFKRLREEIRKQHELTLAVLQRGGGTGNALTVNGVPANSVTVSNAPGVQATQESSAGNSFLRKAAAPATGVGVALAIYEALRRMMGGG